MSLGDENPQELVGTVSGGKSYSSIFMSHIINSSTFSLAKGWHYYWKPHKVKPPIYAVSIFTLFTRLFYLYVCSIKFNEITRDLDFLKTFSKDITHSSDETSNKCTLYQVLPAKIQGKTHIKMWSKNSLNHWDFRPRFW